MLKTRRRRGGKVVGVFNGIEITATGAATEKKLYAQWNGVRLEAHAGEFLPNFISRVLKTQRRRGGRVVGVFNEIEMEITATGAKTEKELYAELYAQWAERGAKKPVSSPLVNQGLGARVQGAEFASDEIRATKDEVGGIDLNPLLMDLQIKRDGNGIPLPLPQQPVENMNIDGFVPVIIHIAPVTNLPLLLGLADTESDKDTSYEGTPSLKAREPEEVSLLN